MHLTDQQTALFDFVKTYHGDQKRKYTGAPYWTHLISVAEIVAPYSAGLMEVEIALCHDLIEDTKATYDNLADKLKALHYLPGEMENILIGVQDLTDVFIHENYPALNRQQRKALEAERLIQTSAHSQTVKYADIIDNTTSIVEQDPGFAKIYIGEVNRYLGKLDKGNHELYQHCLQRTRLATQKIYRGQQEQ